MEQVATTTTDPADPSQSQTNRHEDHMDMIGISDTDKLNRSPPGSYTRLPPANQHETMGAPPILPPHLLQIILNNPDKNNVTILPQPNHVMLNHLYALSIKDGIMVLSATHRFRRKYVTTLLFKPIQ